MNRKNGQKTLAGASTAHYSTQVYDFDFVLNKSQKLNRFNLLQSAYESRTGSSGFHSFLKWFKKDESGRSIRNTSSSKLNKEQNSNYFNSINEIRTKPSSQPNRNGLSASSSCDSIISTATTGFAFIPPNQYRPNGNASQVSVIIM